jgi:chromate transporter
MDKKRSNLWEVIRLFFKLGSIAFGGPAAHIAMMENEVVTKRKWMDKQHFLDLVGATNLIPGPNSTEMTMHCGHERAGVLGLFAAGLAFIFPAVTITLFISWLYVTYGELPQVEAFVFGIKPAVIALIAAAVMSLGKKALKGLELGVLGAAVVAAGILGVNEIAALLLAGILGAFYFSIKNRSFEGKKNFLPFLAVNAVSAGVGSLTTIKIFWIFLKVGAILYGGGYVLFAYLDAELVSTGWLSRSELMDAVAVGQFTPGPVLSTATFIGYQLNGFWGAMAATIGIFLPSFLFVLILNPLIPKMRKSKLFSYFLDSVNVAAVAVMVVVLVEMSRDTLVDWRAVVIAVLSFIVAFGFKKISSMWTVIGGALLGYLLLLV